MAVEAPPKYHYDPSLATAAVFAALFALSAIWHLLQLVKARTWYFLAFFCGVICMGSSPSSFALQHNIYPFFFFAVESVGYAARCVNASETPNWSSTPFIIQTLLPLLGPALFAASIYMILGRLIRILNAERLSFVRTKWLTKIFVLGDVLSFAVQCIGRNPDETIYVCVRLTNDGQAVEYLLALEVKAPSTVVRMSSCLA